MSLLERYQRVRSKTEQLTAPLSDEDQLLQSMASASPAKWHRGHTTWFFETFVLGEASPYARVFNSYYDALDPARARLARDKRGLLSRPSAREVGDYRRRIDERVTSLLESRDSADAHPLLELGLAHEEQHQELILTDILHAFAQNPLAPAYRLSQAPAQTSTRQAGEGSRPSTRRDAPNPGGRSWTRFDGGLVEIGAGAGFAFDNELPRHRVWLEPFSLADDLVTVGEMRAFIAAGGYTTPTLWLNDGFDVVAREQWRAPIYWRFEQVFTLEGLRELRDDEPLTHVSFYEADAVARFLGARLPTEAEWEHASSSMAMLDEAWQWTRSAYEPYPGFTPLAAAAEYNGKFMSGQMVLRGGSRFSPPGHVRPSYRNFWPPETRFQLSAVRLAR